MTSVSELIFFKGTRGSCWKLLCITAGKKEGNVRQVLLLRLLQICGKWKSSNLSCLDQQNQRRNGRSQPCSILSASFCLGRILVTMWGFCSSWAAHNLRCCLLCPLLHKVLCEMCSGLQGFTLGRGRSVRQKYQYYTETLQGTSHLK